MSQNFDGKKSFPSASFFVSPESNRGEVPAEKKRSGRLPTNPLHALKQANKPIEERDQTDVSEIDLLKEASSIYLNKLFVLWKTGYNGFDDVLSYQVILDVSIMIKMWEKYEEKSYREFWAKAFSSKKGKK